MRCATMDSGVARHLFGRQSILNAKYWNRNSHPLKLFHYDRAFKELHSLRGNLLAVSPAVYSASRNINDRISLLLD